MRGVKVAWSSFQGGSNQMDGLHLGHNYCGFGLLMLERKNENENLGHKTFGGLATTPTEIEIINYIYNSGMQMWNCCLIVRDVRNEGQA